MARYDQQFMRHTDALTWNMEHDPGLRSTIVGVVWLESSPDVDVLSARLDRATRLAPRFRQRPVRPPGLFATPRWVDCDVDLSIHLRRIDAPVSAHAPHGRRVRPVRGHDRVRSDPAAVGHDPRRRSDGRPGRVGGQAPPLADRRRRRGAARMVAVRVEPRAGTGGPGGGRVARARAQRTGTHPRGALALGAGHGEHRARAGWDGSCRPPRPRPGTHCAQPSTSWPSPARWVVS